MRGMSGIFSIAAAVLRALAEIEPLVSARETHTNAFDVEATVALPTDTLGDQFSLTDGTVYLRMTDGAFSPPDVLRPGDRIRARGTLVRQDNDLYNYARATRIDILAHGEPPPPVDVAITDLLGGKFLNRPVRTQGTVIDVFRDEIDPRFVILTLVASNACLYASSVHPGPDTSLEAFLNARVSVLGFCVAFHPTDSRHNLGLFFSTRFPEDVRIVHPAPDDPFDVPPLAGTIHDIRQAVQGDQPRRKVAGTVLAVWGGRHLLLRQKDGNCSHVLLSGEAAPSPGDDIEAVGIPEMNAHNLNLSRAAWRPSPEAAHVRAHAADALPVTAGQLLTDGDGRRKIKPRYEGSRVRMSGIVRKLVTDENGFSSAAPEADGHDIPINFSSPSAVPPGLTAGCRVEVSGICVLMTENGRSPSPLSRTTGFRIVCDTPDDVRILTRPPWWTPAHSLVLIGILFVGLVGILVWNVLLRHLSDRKGRALAKTRLARDTSEIKMRERTRLATELHDNIVQNLTGVTLGLRTVDRLSDTNHDAARRQLRLAVKALDACRGEIRNCIWDLRSHALDAPDMGGVLRRTLMPFAREAQIVITFPVLRTDLSDNEVHALACVVRELVLNAIRHGKATAVRIDGHRTGERLVISVTDDGCGFDVETAPGISDGHYGLQGVRERIEALHGDLSISSVLGKGTTVSVDVRLSARRDAKEAAT